MCSPLDRISELFTKRALVIGDRAWGLYEIIAYGSSRDDRVETVDLITRQNYETYAIDDVIAFIGEDEIRWVETSVDEAYHIFLSSDGTDRDWDTFRVTVRLLV